MRLTTHITVIQAKRLTAVYASVIWKLEIQIVVCFG